MAQGRTTLRHVRFYADGYDLSGYTRDFGPLKCDFEAEDEAALSDGVKNALAGHASLGIGTLNGFFDNTQTAGLHAVANGAGVKRVVMALIGIQAAPSAGEPAYVGEFYQVEYSAKPEKGFVVASIPFSQFADDAATRLYSNPWGVLLAADATRTAPDVNTAIGVDDHGGASTFGGFMCYQLLTSNGTITLTVQDAATNLDASFANLSGATSGAIDATTTPRAGIVALGTTATVRRYLRPQWVWGTATTARFLISFHRAKY